MTAESVKGPFERNTTKRICNIFHIQVMPMWEVYSPAAYLSKIFGTKKHEKLPRRAIAHSIWNPTFIRRFTLGHCHVINL
jgi:hypothetical protein